jgi:hypothetical protein
MEGQKQIIEEDKKFKKYRCFLAGIKEAIKYIFFIIHTSLLHFLC